MAPHLIKKNFVEKLYVYDIDNTSVNKLVNIGAIKCSTIEEVSKNSEIIITMLPASKQVKLVYDSLLSNSKGNQLYIDTSTIDPQTAQDVSKLVRKKQSTFCDAPVRYFYF
jgi:3-hydroxyisobutyrate dehydrogenase